MAPDGQAAVEDRAAGSAKGPAASASHRLADATALIGLALALLAVLAVVEQYVSGPIADWLQGPDPCGVANGVGQPDIACVLAHPDYYAYDPTAGSLSTRGTQIVETVDADAWSAGGLGALGAVIISGIALATGTRRRRMAVTALIISSLILAWMTVAILGLWFGGGGD